MGKYSNLLGAVIWYGPLVLFASWVATREAMGAIARSCGIRHTWLTWVPFANSWIQGSVSDRCRMAVRGQKKSGRKVLAVLRGVQLLLWVAIVWCWIGGVQDADTVRGRGASERVAELMIIYGIVDSLWWMIPALIVGIVAYVREQMALYDIYATFTPERRVRHLVLSMIPVVNLIAKPLCLRGCREKELPVPTESQ